MRNRSLEVRFVLNRWMWGGPLLLWGVIVAWSFQSNVDSMIQHHFEVATHDARNIFQVVELTRLWNARHGRVYVPVTERTQPNPYLAVPHRDVSTVDGQELTMVNPAFMTRQLSELLSMTRGGVSFHITSLKPIRPANKADAWETDALLQFEQGIEEVVERLISEESDLFRYMAPLVVKPACMKCHEKQGYETGQVRGGISVTLQSGPFFASLDGRVEREFYNHLLIYLLVAGLFVLFLEKVRRQWLALEALEESQEKIIKERTRKLEQLATHDPLTGLYNRNAMNTFLSREFSRSARYGHPLTMLMVDLDHFKEVNDEHGHLAGDMALTYVASILAESVRKTDTVARFGGEEFIMLMPEMGADEAERFAERLREKIASQPISLQSGVRLTMTASFGVACYPDHANSIDDLLIRSDNAMYAAKRAGRNCVVVYSADEE